MKLSIAEEHSNVARAAWDAADRRAISRIGYVEARAALAAAVRERRLTGGEHERARTALDRFFGAMLVVELAPGLAREAGERAERHSLRGYDAVHLASALVFQPDDVMMISWDGALVRASRECGLPVIST